MKKIIIIAVIFIITFSIIGTVFVSANLDNYVTKLQEKYNMIIVT
jgi:hypothetical protein